MIIDNNATEIGDEILIEAEAPIIGLIALTGFVDVVVGETGDKFFTKHFRYSTNGITYSNWELLTVENLQAVVVDAKDTFLIDYKYTRTGTDGTGDLEFVSIVLEGQFIVQDCGETISRSIFCGLYCSNPKVQVLCLAFVNKMYERGVLPEYIERKSENPDDDIDFINFWKAVGCFFAMIRVFAEKFENLFFDRDMLFEYLLQRGIYFCNEISLQDLQYICENYYDEIRKRGTIEIIRKKNLPVTKLFDSTQVLETSEKFVDGELLRLICFNKDKHEFGFSGGDSKLMSWNVGNSSPLYKGLQNFKQLNKAPEQTQDFVDLTKYTLYNDSYCSVVNDVDKNVLQISAVPNGSVSGIFSNFSLSTEMQKAIIINPFMAYEITFMIKQNELGNYLSFACAGFDELNNPVDFYNIKDGSITNNFFSLISMQRNDQYFLIRGIIYGHSHSNLPGNIGNLDNGLGNHLRFSSTCKKIFPFIYVDNTNNLTNSVNIWDFKVKPLSTYYSRYFAQANNFFQYIFNNNNGKYSDSDIEEIMRNKLLPYNCNFKVLRLNKLQEIGSYENKFHIQDKLIIVNSTIITGKVGQSYKEQLIVIGGGGDYLYNLIGILPDGLSLSLAGEISGIPTTAGKYDFSVVVSDSLSISEQKDYSLTILN